MSAVQLTNKEMLLAGRHFAGRRNNHCTFRYNDEDKTIEKWVHAGGVWDYYCLANKINDKGFTGTISFIGITIVTRIFEFKDMIFLESHPEKSLQP